MGQALYRRYRSKNLAEIVGQEHITHTLDNTLKRGAIAHAYLLTGPRGVGKTSIARILAHEINQLPYENEKVHLDIIEIDAASNRRIDEIRDLRDKVHTAPVSSRYKIYIIDEVHMLTKEAFNALLKTLEEPPQHVIFILATTDVHKLPETIISRTQHFTFRPIPAEKIFTHLASIAKKERIHIDDKALMLLAEHGRGSFRDSIGLLEQAQGISEHITEEDVRKMLGVPPVKLIDELIAAFYARSAKKLTELLFSLHVQGYLAEEIAHQISAKLRDELISGVNRAQLSSLLVDLIDVPASREPNVLLEVTLLKHMTAQTAEATTDSSQQTRRSQEQSDKQQSKESRPLPTKAIAVRQKPSTAVEKTPKKQTQQPHAATPQDAVWEEALRQLRQSHSTLYSIARMAACQLDGNTMTLTFQFPFHKKRMETAKHTAILTEILRELMHEVPIVHFQLADKADSEPKNTKQTEEQHPIKTISNIFGSAEVLES